MLLFQGYGITFRRDPSAQATCGRRQSPACHDRAGRSFFAVASASVAAGVIIANLMIVPLAHAQNISCTCRYKGEDYGVGESICLKSSEGLKMATCEMVLNNTSWQISNAPCPVTQLNDGALEDLGELPIIPTEHQDTNGSSTG